MKESIEERAELLITGILSISPDALRKLLSNKLTLDAIFMVTIYSNLVTVNGPLATHRQFVNADMFYCI